MGSLAFHFHLVECLSPFPLVHVGSVFAAYTASFHSCSLRDKCKSGFGSVKLMSAYIVCSSP